MFTNPSEEGAAAPSTSESIDKQWVTEQLSTMKEEITKDVMEKVLGEVNKQMSKFNDNSCTKEDKKAEPNAKEESKGIKEDVKLIHVGVICDNCDSQISGIRYKCGDCEDFDLCEVCESLPNMHDIKHVFLKIRHPIPVCPALQKRSFHAKLIGKETGDLNATKIENFLRRRSVDSYPTIGINAEFVFDETVPPGTMFKPGENFVKRWRVRNLGCFKWDSYTTVRMRRSHPSFQPLHTEVAVPQLEPYQEGVVSVTFIAPKTPGYFESLWVFYYNDLIFGDVLWCKIIVSDPSVEAPLPFETISPRTALLKNWKCEYPQCRAKHKSKDKHKKKDHGKRKIKPIFDVLALSHAETDGTDLCPLKYVTSHTATPNNTPFDLTPPKSPEPKELAESKKENVDADNEDNSTDLKEISSIQILDLDDKASFGTPSSSESDSEFVVIPMPKCFNLSEPYKPESVILAKEPVAIKGISTVEWETVPTLNIVQKESDVPRKAAISENVSQETGVPEQAENYFVYHQPVKPMPDVCYLISDIHMNNSPSSSSVSIIDSDCNSPTVEPQNLITIETNRDTIGKPEVVKPIIEISEATVTENISGTFPKFPVEDIGAENIAPYSPGTPENKEERTIQVLPEGLVTGALLAAATVYNTARGIISSIQPGKNDQENLPDGMSSPVIARPPQRSICTLSPMQQLLEMGFCNVDKNEQLLRKYENNVVKVIEELINMSDNDWYASRQVSDH